MMYAGWAVAAVLTLMQDPAATAPQAAENPSDLAVCGMAAHALHSRLSQGESPDSALLEVVAAVRDQAMTRLEGLDPVMLESADAEAVARVQSMRVGQAVEVVGDCALGFGVVSDDR